MISDSVVVKLRRLAKQSLLFQSKMDIRREHSSVEGATIKVAVLVWLTLQNSVHTLLIRYSRARDVPEMFFSSVAVFLTEIIKVVICLYMVIWETNGLLP